MDEQLAKGTAIIPEIVFVKTKYGERGWEQLLKQVSPLARQVLSQKVLPVTWYPHEVLTSLLDTIVAMYGKGDPKFGHVVGKEGADYGLTLIHKIVFRLRSPALLASNGPEVWNMYYQPSTIEVTRNTPGWIALEVRGLETTPAHLHAVAGWMERVAELTGGKNATVQVEVQTKRFDINYE